MTVRFGSARIDENGNICGGKAGDQNGKEVAMQDYYMSSKGWYCFRPKDIKLAKGLSKSMKDACNNNNIGYDQYQRNGVEDYVRRGIRIADIPNPTETDCSALVDACCLENGVDIGTVNTESLPAALDRSGKFEKRFSVTSSSQLREGDIVVTKVKGHVVICVQGAIPLEETKQTITRRTYSGQMPKLPKRGYFRLGDIGTEVKNLKKFLNWYGDYKLTENNPNYFLITTSAVKKFQKANGLVVDGEFGPKSLAKAKTVKK